jgi:hypothetical protein
VIAKMGENKRRRREALVVHYHDCDELLLLLCSARSVKYKCIKNYFHSLRCFCELSTASVEGDHDEFTSLHFASEALKSSQPEMKLYKWMGSRSDIMLHMNKSIMLMTTTFGALAVYAVM